MHDKKKKRPGPVAEVLQGERPEEARPVSRLSAGNLQGMVAAPAGMPLSARIERICRSDATERELRDFVVLCVRLACGTLRVLESRGYRIFEQRAADAGEAERIALDALADLFERNPSGEFIRLRRYFDPHLQEGLSDEECLMLLRRLVFNRTRQGVFHSFRDRDPQGAKLYRCIKLAVFKDERYETEEHLGREWICVKNAGKASRRCKVRLTEWENLKPELFCRFRPVDDTPEMLEKIFDHARSVSNGPVLVALDDAARLIREYRQILAKPESEATAVSDSEDSLLTDETGKALDLIMAGLFRKIDGSYVAKGRMDPDCAQGLKNALAGLVRDLKDGHPLYPGIHYLREHLHDAGKGARTGILQSRFEYMVKLLKKRIADDLYFPEKG